MIAEYRMDGVLEKSTVLSSQEVGVHQALGILMPKGVWHSTSAGVEGAVFLEVRPGPFRKEKTRYLKQEECKQQ